VCDNIAKTTCDEIIQLLHKFVWDYVFWLV